MHPDGYNVSADLATIRSSGALPDSGLPYTHDDPPESPTIMAQPGLTAFPPAIPERDPRHEDIGRPSEDITAIKAVPQFGTTRARGSTQPGRERKGSNAASMMETSHFPPMDPDMGIDDPPHHGAPPPPSRTPSRQQVMRWGPPPTPSDYGYDDMTDRKYYPRSPYDYGMPPRAQPPHWYGEEQPPYYNRPYQRRMSSVRESTEWGGGQGPPRPPRRPRYRSYDDGSDGESDERPLRRPRKKRSRDSDRSSPPPDVIMRLPFTDWMNTTVKGHFVATIGEFMGTTMFLIFAFAGTQVANIGSTENEAQTTTNASTGFSPIVLLYIALSFGFSLMTNVWIFFRISGGLFNPAVTLSMVMVKAISVSRGLLLVGSQLVGAVFASYVVSVLFPTTFNVRTTLSADTSVVRGVFIEAILTAELVFAIFMLANEKHKATFMAPIGIGLALFIAEMVGVYYTGGSLNPARSFGPCVVSGVWDNEHWIYWVGPTAGALIAWGFYKIIKVLEYEMANPGQESSSKEEAAQEAADVAPDVTPRKETV